MSCESLDTNSDETFANGQQSSDLPESLNSELSPNRSEPQFSVKVLELYYTLKEDIYACDAKWNVFVSAAKSFRYEIMLRPFPPDYMKNKICQIDDLIAVINETPPIRTVVGKLRDEKNIKISIKVFDLLYWVLVYNREPIFRSLSVDEYNLLVGAIMMPDDILKPTCVFDVYKYKDEDKELHFERAARYRRTKLAFYPIKLDTIYAVINNGFQMPQVMQPLRLTENIETCLQNCLLSSAWGKSYSGTMMACFALCEYVLPDGDYVKAAGDACIAPGEFLCGSDLIRIRYLFFYNVRVPSEIKIKKSWSTWFVENKYIFKFLLYLFIIFVAAAIVSSHTSVRHIILKHATIMYDNGRQFLLKKQKQLFEIFVKCKNFMS